MDEWLQLKCEIFKQIIVIDNLNIPYGTAWM